jgi:hypothetical protein
MVNIFRETYTSLQDNNYGQVIIQKSLRQVIWYWTKYLLILMGIIVLIVIFLLTNKLPQLPKFIDSNLPDAEFRLQDGVFSTTLSQPQITGDSDYSFILDSAATSSALDTYKSGILITSTDLIVKSEDGTFTTQSFKNIPSFATSKLQIKSFVETHLTQIWFGVLAAILIISLFVTALVWTQRFTSMLIWSAIFLFLVKFFIKRSMNFADVLKIVIYASVLPLLFSFILSVSPNPLLDIFNLGLMAYFAFNWIWHLPSITQQPIEPEVLPPPKKRVSHRSAKKTA